MAVDFKKYHDMRRKILDLGGNPDGHVLYITEEEHQEILDYFNNALTLPTDFYRPKHYDDQMPERISKFMGFNIEVLEKGTET